MNVALRPQDQSHALSAFTPYRKRPLRFLGVWEEADWHIKLYGMCAAPQVPETGVVRPDFIARAKEIALPVLQGETGTNHHGLGFMLLHEGRLGNWILLDWWTDEILLQHRYFGSSPERRLDFSPWLAGHIACVWEMAILGFEREAWIDAQSGGHPDRARAYLANTLQSDV